MGACISDSNLEWNEPKTVVVELQQIDKPGAWEAASERCRELVRLRTIRFRLVARRSIFNWNTALQLHKFKQRCMRDKSDKKQQRIRNEIKALALQVSESNTPESC